MGLAMPLAFAVLGYGLIGFLVVVLFIVLIVRPVRGSSCTRQSAALPSGHRRASRPSWPTCR